MRKPTPAKYITKRYCSRCGQDDGWYEKTQEYGQRCPIHKSVLRIRRHTISTKQRKRMKCQ